MVLARSLALAAPLLILALTNQAESYCNSMGGQGYGPRTSKAFPPGWNGLAKTPVRGWRSWYAYYTHMDQAMIKEAVDALVAKNRTVAGWDGKVSLCDLGYCMAGIDEGWEGCGEGVNGTQHYVNGTPATAPTFPDMKGLVEYGHSKGLKMGWYFNGCGCIEKREPASGWGINYEGDIALLADYGFDGVKFDGCGRMCNMTFYADLMNKTGKPFAIENCHWGDCTVDDASSCPTKDWCPFNWFRTSGDSNNGMGTWYKNLQTTIKFQDWDEPLSQPGCWAYPDMLQVGRLGCPTKTHGCPMPSLYNWSKTHFASFCIVSSPLVISIHPSDANLDPILDIIGNKQAIAINKAWAGHPGSLVKNYQPVMPPAPPAAPGNDVVGAACSKTDKTETGFAYDATKNVITHGGLCLSTTGWGLPLTLDTCGGTGLFQSFTYDPKSKHFNSKAPANGPVSPCCLEVVEADGEAATLAKVYRCGGGSAAAQVWSVDAATGAISNTQNSQQTCLAARSAPAGKPVTGVAGIQLWAKPLGAGKTAALFINGGAVTYPSTPITLQELNVTGLIAAAAGAGAKVTDVWTGEDAGAVVNGVWSTGPVASLDSKFVIFDTSAASAEGL